MLPAPFIQAVQGRSADLRDYETELCGYTVFPRTFQVGSFPHKPDMALIHMPLNLPM